MYALLLCALFISSSRAQPGRIPFPRPTDRNNSEIDDIRLRNSAYGDHAGRIEVLYNGTWGTICDNFWSFSDAEVACRMLDFSRSLCPVSRGQFGSADLEVPILMDRLTCFGNEEALDLCGFSGWEQNSCDHSEDAGVICYSDDVVMKTGSVSLVEATRTTLVVKFPTLRSFPVGAAGNRYSIRYSAVGSRSTRTRIVRVAPNFSGRELNYTMTSLTRDTGYTVQVRPEFRYRECGSYMQGNYSDPVTLRTTNQVPPSEIPVRLVPPEPSLDFIGRLEVFHNGRWGTVCDDFFGFREANIICGMLNHTSAGCAVTRARLGEGTGQIWLDNVRCSSSAEVLDDCTYSPWGVHNCDHGDDVGVVCIPDDYPPQIENVTVTHVSSNTVTLSWTPFEFPRIATLKRYSISYTREDFNFAARVYPSSDVNTFTIQNLQFLLSYNFTVRAELQFSSCFRIIQGVSSDPVTATPQESAPSSAPISFHVTVLSCNEIRAEWELPLLRNRNGVIRGFIVYVQPAAGGEELVMGVAGNRTTELIIGNLTSSTSYVVSVLAYTVANGPRSIHLTVTTNTDDICHRDIINFFGLNGDGLNRATAFSHQRNVHILCGTSLPGVQLDWFFSNGTKVGNNNRNIREGHFRNGTTSLQFGSDRTLSPCDSGVYTCRANQSETRRIEEKTFKLTIDNIPPAPSRPRLLTVTDTTITIAWDVSSCNGGHRLDSFTIRYYLPGSFFFIDLFPRYSFIYNIDVNQRNYTIMELSPTSSYQVAIATVNEATSNSRYSPTLSVSTLTPAPTPPRRVSAELITPVVIKVTWSRPSVTRGATLVFYTVYAIPFVSQVSPSLTRGKRQVENQRLDTVAKNFSSSVTTGNITVHEQAITYHVQVSATLRLSTGILRETSLSDISNSNTIRVPLPGLPVPANVEVERTSNSSVTLSWELPPPPRDQIWQFQVFYSGLVDGVSPAGILVRFQHEGTVATTSGEDTSITIQPLTPGTNYLFRVSAISERGKGMEIDKEAQTEGVRSSLERFVYFNIRFGPVFSCHDFRSGDIEDKRESVKDHVISELSRLCNCDISYKNIQDDAFGCGQLDHLITYRGRLLGSDDYSALGLVELMEFWVNSEQAFLTVDSFRMRVDPTCSTRLDTVNAPDCPLGDDITTTPTTPAPRTTITPTTPAPRTTITPTTSAPTKSFGTTIPPKIEVESSSAIRSGEIGGIAIGVIIVILLVALLLVIAAIILYKTRVLAKVTLRNSGNTHLVNEDDKAPFADLEPRSHESSLFEEKMKD